MILNHCNTIYFQWAIFWIESGTKQAKTITHSKAGPSRRSVLLRLFYSSGWTVAFVARSIWSNWTKPPRVCVNSHKSRPFWPGALSLYPATSIAFPFPFHKDEQTEHYRSATPQRNRCSPAPAPPQPAEAEWCTLLSPHPFIVLCVLFSSGNPKALRRRINKWINRTDGMQMSKSFSWGGHNFSEHSRLTEETANAGRSKQRAKYSLAVCGRKWHYGHELRVHTYIHTYMHVKGFSCHYGSQQGQSPEVSDQWLLFFG